MAYTPTSAANIQPEETTGGTYCRMRASLRLWPESLAQGLLRLDPDGSREIAVGLRQRLHHRRRAAIIDSANRLLYGRGAPRLYERMWIDPQQIEVYIPLFDRQASARVIGGSWDLAVEPLAEHATIQGCRLHWQDGVPWNEAGVIELRTKERGSTLAQVLREYEALDRIFETVQREGRIRTAEELYGEYREYGGPFVHVDREGRPIFGGGGFHRLAMAVVLGLSELPAHVGVVHSGAIGRLDYLRSPA